MVAGTGADVRLAREPARPDPARRRDHHRARGRRHHRRRPPEVVTPTQEFDDAAHLEVFKGGLTLDGLVNLGIAVGQNLPYNHVVQGWSGGTGAALAAFAAEPWTTSCSRAPRWRTSAATATGSCSSAPASTSLNARRERHPGARLPQVHRRLAPLLGARDRRCGRRRQAGPRRTSPARATRSCRRLGRPRVRQATRSGGPPATTSAPPAPTAPTRARPAPRATAPPSARAS